MLSCSLILPSGGLTYVSQRAHKGVRIASDLFPIVSEPSYRIVRVKEHRVHLYLRPHFVPLRLATISEIA